MTNESPVAQVVELGISFSEYACVNHWKNIILNIIRFHKTLPYKRNNVLTYEYLH